jgi:hypothetical protein
LSLSPAAAAGLQGPSAIFKGYSWALDTFVDYSWQRLTELNTVLIVLLVVETVCIQARQALWGRGGGGGVPLNAARCWRPPPGGVVRASPQRPLPPPGPLPQMTCMVLLTLLVRVGRRGGQLQGLSLVPRVAACVPPLPQRSHPHRRLLPFSCALQSANQQHMRRFSVFLALPSATLRAMAARQLMVGGGVG